MQRVDPAAQLIADNIHALESPQGIVKLTWLMSEEQARVRYQIGAGIVNLLRKHGHVYPPAGDLYLSPALAELLERWESDPKLRRGTAARELREALGR